MRKLTLLTALVVSMMVFSSTSFADWKRVNKNEYGDTYYVDFERIRKHDGYVYYWGLSDSLKSKKYRGSQDGFSNSVRDKELF